MLAGTLVQHAVPQKIATAVARPEAGRLAAVHQQGHHCAGGLGRAAVRAQNIVALAQNAAHIVHMLVQRGGMGRCEQHAGNQPARLAAVRAAAHAVSHGPEQAFVPTQKRILVFRADIALLAPSPGFKSHGKAARTARHRTSGHHLYVISYIKF